MINSELLRTLRKNLDLQMYLCCTVEIVILLNVCSDVQLMDLWPTLHMHKRLYESTLSPVFPLPIMYVR